MSSHTTLIVDDHQSLRRLTATLLRLEGFTVYQAGSGGTALEALHAHPEIETVLLDLTMPGMSGEVTLRHIKAHWPRVRVIVTSGKHDTPARNLADAFVAKPYQTDELVSALTGSDKGMRRKVT